MTNTYLVIYSPYSHNNYYFKQPLLNPSPPYRKYALRRVKDYFRETRSFTDSVAIEREYSYGLESLNMLKRQVGVNNYVTPLI